MKLLNLKSLAKIEDFYLFSYEVDNELEFARVKLINDGKNYEIKIGFGGIRTNMIIERYSHMGRRIASEIKKDIE